MTCRDLLEHPVEGHVYFATSSYEHLFICEWRAGGLMPAMFMEGLGEEGLKRFKSSPIASCLSQIP